MTATRDRNGTMGAGFAPAPGQRAVGYTRVSSSGQEKDGLSLVTQRERLTEYAAGHGLDLLEVIAETASGGVRNGEVFSWEHRPALADILDGFKAGAADVLLVVEPDRLARTAADVEVIERMLNQHGATVVFLEGGGNGSAIDKLTRHTLAGFAEYERTLIRARFAHGKAQARRHGRHADGAHPFGYHASTHRGVLEIVESEAEIVRGIFRACRRGHSLAAIAEDLNRRGVKSPRGKTWTRQGVWTILGNRAYLGESIAGIKNAHPAIVTARAFRAAAAARAGKRATASRPAPSG
jgi:DNA invertase Pin-like site-specific DNA recombinase